MKKKFYIIGVPSSYGMGLTAIVFQYMYNIIWAVKNDYIPIVDMMHYNNSYFKDNREFRDNVWEYYFEQPFNITLNDIDEESEVIIGHHEWYENNKMNPPEVTDLPVELVNYKQDERLSNYKNYYKKYIRFNAETYAYIEKQYNTITGNEKEILGVFARGTDYMIRRTNNHCIQPKPDELIKKIKSVLKKYPEIKKIYLATEDLDIFNIFKSEFKDMLLDNGQYRVSYKNKENKYKLLNQIHCNRENHYYKMGLDYLTSLYILSKCRYFVGGRAGGSLAVYYMSEGYKYYYMFDKGVYGKGSERIFSIITETNRNCTYKVYSVLGFKFKINQDKKYFKKFFSKEGNSDYIPGLVKKIFPFLGKKIIK